MKIVLRHSNNGAWLGLCFYSLAIALSLMVTAQFNVSDRVAWTVLVCTAANPILLLACIALGTIIMALVAPANEKDWDYDGRS